mmetsp:Transcript_9795/g.17280  ORF Transcript_9795/g.17280 Transcript_9795/m.17280 type:complete len:272 (+) Transcript_9795:332-1147(+)
MGWLFTTGKRWGWRRRTTRTPSTTCGWTRWRSPRRSTRSTCGTRPGTRRARAACCASATGMTCGGRWWPTVSTPRGSPPGQSRTSWRATGRLFRRWWWPTRAPSGRGGPTTPSPWAGTRRSSTAPTRPPAAASSTCTSASRARRSRRRWPCGRSCGRWTPSCGSCARPPRTTTPPRATTTARGPRRGPSWTRSGRGPRPGSPTCSPSGCPPGPSRPRPPSRQRRARGRSCPRRCSRRRPRCGPSSAARRIPSPPGAWRTWRTWPSATRWCC